MFDMTHDDFHFFNFFFFIHRLKCGLRLLFVYCGLLMVSITKYITQSVTYLDPMTTPWLNCLWIIAGIEFCWHFPYCRPEPTSFQTMLANFEAFICYQMKCQKEFRFQFDEVLGLALDSFPLYLRIILIMMIIDCYN